MAADGRRNIIGRSCWLVWHASVNVKLFPPWIRKRAYTVRERLIHLHLHARYTGPELLIHATETPPLGPGFTAQQAADADALEVWVSSLEDIADTTVFRLMRRDAAIAVSQIGGF